MPTSAPTPNPARNQASPYDLLSSAITNVSSRSAQRIHDQVRLPPGTLSPARQSGRAESTPICAIDPAARVHPAVCALDAEPCLSSLRGRIGRQLLFSLNFPGPYACPGNFLGAPFGDPSGALTG